MNRTIGLIVLVLMTSFTFAKDKSIVMEFQNGKGKTWVLESAIRSPWNAILVPNFIDFSVGEGKVLLWSFGGKSESVRGYSIDGNKLILDTDVVWNFRDLADTNSLVLEIEDQTFTYYPMEKRNDEVFIDKVNQILLSKGKWNLNNDIFEFTTKNDATKIGAKEVVKHAEKMKYYGSYLWDTFKGNTYLVILIDGEYVQRVYQITSYSEQSIEFVELRRHSEMFSMKAL